MRKKTSMLSISLPLANFLFNLSSVALVLGAVAVLAGTIGTVWTGSVKERYGDERIAANEAETARAKESAALANERSLKLAVELEQERIARLEIEARVQEQGVQVKGLMPRRLSDDQKKNINNEASKKPYTISIAHDMAAADAKFLVADLSAAFQAAGWTVMNPVVMGLGMPPRTGLGVQVLNVDNLSDAEKIVKTIFAKSQLPFDILAIPQRNWPDYVIKPDVELVLTTPAK